ncbi:MmgE/PrpD family protein [Limobrevibacterium gyesilva]|uniref:MmgE/PrpD family protein n=1 Tax=Limobrevibacterium gyesilva TaxID=2991712 RepID=A0AA41YPC0_9PROT|nr:MmgE/PrpD family protein [Limobrevibacterium gyesilva]MCW3474040.1 MmgE/PrpD family protein [Limobrevibacterium gyesilva]
MSTTDGLTREIARRALAVRHADLPDDIRMLARQCVLDTLGAAIAGRDDSLTRILAEELAEQGGAPAAGIIGSALRLPTLSAALLNGTASHALDYDDVNLFMPGHPSVAVLPAVLALAEERGAGGAAVIAAFVAGYETACRVGKLLAPGHYDGLGFHATGTVGTFGAAAGCAHLLGLDLEKTVHALGIAATQAAGLKSMFGTMCKPLHAGRAAYNGLLAARLAARGFTARPDSLECAQGFARTHSPDFNPSAALDDPAGGWHIRHNLFKYHAACYLTHAGIEAARTLREAHHVAPDAIAAITLRVDKATDRVCNIAEPRTGLEAKFSLRLTTAMALAGRDTGRLDAYNETTATDPTLVALRDRVVVDFQSGWPTTRAEVDIRLADQTTLRAVHDSGVPAADIPEQGRRLEEKFLGLVTPVLGDSRAPALVDAIAGMEDAPSLSAISTLWVPEGTARQAAE